MASSSSGRIERTRRLLGAAIAGNLRDLKKAVAELGDYQGKELGKRVIKVKDDNGINALHFAAAEGKFIICKYLIDELEIDVDIKDPKGATPLLHASLGGFLSTAVYLLLKGADPNVRNDSGFAPLHYAAFEGHNELLELLISRGADVNAVSSLGTPLQRAAGVGKHEAVKILLDHHANPNLYFNHVSTPLVASILAQSLRCVKLFIEAGADPNAGSCGAIPLVLAAFEGETEMIKCLLKAGADPDVIDDGLKPIEIAALRGNHQDVHILYPVTTPIPTYSDWSMGGIMRHVLSEGAKEQRRLKAEQGLEEAKQKGEEAFLKKDYLTAITWYTKAIFENPLDATMLSNRSLCWARLKEGDRALSDAQACVMLKPEWPKAYYREGAAWNILEKFDQAADAFCKGLKVAPENKELQNAFQEAVQARMKSMKVTQGRETTQIVNQT